MTNREKYTTESARNEAFKEHCLFIRTRMELQCFVGECDKCRERWLNRDADSEPYHSRLVGWALRNRNCFLCHGNPNSARYQGFPKFSLQGIHELPSERMVFGWTKADVEDIRKEWNAYFKQSKVKFVRIAIELKEVVK